MGQNMDIINTVIYCQNFVLQYQKILSYICRFNLCQCKGHLLDAPFSPTRSFWDQSELLHTTWDSFKKMQSIVVCIYVDNSYYVGSGAESATRVTASKSILWPSSGRSKQYFHNTIIWRYVCDCVKLTLLFLVFWIQYRRAQTQIWNTIVAY